LLPERGRVFLENVPIARRLPAMTTLPAVEGMFDRAFQQAFYVDRDIPTATATIARDIQGVLGDRLTVPPRTAPEPPSICSPSWVQTAGAPRPITPYCTVPSLFLLLPIFPLFSMGGSQVGGDVRPWALRA
jgi:hypothetical protein